MFHNKDTLSRQDTKVEKVNYCIIELTYTFLIDILPPYYPQQAYPPAAQVAPTATQQSVSCLFT